MLSKLCTHTERRWCPLTLSPEIRGSECGGLDGWGSPTARVGRGPEAHDLHLGNYAMYQRLQRAARPSEHTGENHGCQTLSVSTIDHF